MKYRDLVSSWLQETEQLNQTVQEELAVLSARQLQYSIHPEKWNITQCLQHVVLFNASYFRKIENAINSMGPGTTSPEFRQSHAGLILWKRVQLSNLQPYKTRAEFDPVKHPGTRSVFGIFQKQHEQFEQMMKRSCAVDYNKPVIPALFFGFIRISIAETLHFMVLHQKKHLRQALHLRSLLPEK